MSRTPDAYRERSERFSRERDRYARRRAWWELGRLLTFLGAVALFASAEAAPAARPALIGFAILSSLGFLASVAAHRRARAAATWYEELARINDEASGRAARRWADLPVSEVEGPGEHPYAGDLDLFGRASLFQLVDTTGTVVGRHTLREWLLEPATPETVLHRQDAVAELAPRVDLRDELAALARLGGRGDRRSLERLLAWARAEPWLLHRPGLLWTSRALPLSTMLLLGLQLAGLLRYPLWVIPLGGALLLTAYTRRPMHARFASASLGEAGLRRLDELLKLLSEARFESPLLRRTQRELVPEGIPAHVRLLRFRRLLACADLRFSQLSHFAIQLITLWDFHVLFALERWRGDWGPFIPRWVAGLGEVEALSALAALAHAHPGWSFPEISRNRERELEAQGLGHPLLRPETCVGNDVHIGPPGTVLFVTGSNMTGKTTLLKALGVNVVLALAGGPVCAARLRLPPVRLATALYARESLEDGTSHFVAELKRVNEVVRAARTARGRGTIVLYLLDDVLRGTNVSERQIAVRRILRSLLKEEAIGALTSHDLALPDADDLTDAAHRVHFAHGVRRTADGPALEFDYRLRPGVATSTNALQLLEMLGLGDGPASRA